MQKKIFHIFYSWQSDLKNSTNRSFIEKCIQNATSILSKDADIDVEAIIDRDTAGLSGSPDIVSSIFNKIAKCNLFICDVSIVGKLGERPCPNPNVLIELGYAIKTLGFEKIIMVLNSAYGKAEILPFDLRMKRVTSYSLSEENCLEPDYKKVKLRKLSESIAETTRILLKCFSEEEGNNIIESIITNKSSLPFDIKYFVEKLINDVRRINDSIRDESNAIKRKNLLRKLIIEFQPRVIEFYKVCDHIALSNSIDNSHLFFKEFYKILEYYDKPINYSGGFSDSDFDFIRFQGYHLFLIFLSQYINHRRYNFIGTILKEVFTLSVNQNFNRLEIQDFRYFSFPTDLLMERNDNSVTLQSRYLYYIYNEIIYEKAEISYDTLTDIDFLIYLRCELDRTENETIGNIYDDRIWNAWTLWSTKIHYKVPSVIKRLNQSYFETVKDIIGISEFNYFKTLCRKRTELITKNEGSYSTKRDFISMINF